MDEPVWICRYIQYTLPFTPCPPHSAVFPGVSEKGRDAVSFLASDKVLSMCCGLNNQPDSYNPNPKYKITISSNMKANKCLKKSGGVGNGLHWNILEHIITKAVAGFLTIFQAYISLNTVCHQAQVKCMPL